MGVTGGSETGLKGSAGWNHFLPSVFHDFMGMIFAVVVVVVVLQIDLNILIGGNRVCCAFLIARIHSILISGSWPF